MMQTSVWHSARRSAFKSSHQSLGASNRVFHSSNRSLYTTNRTICSSNRLFYDSMEPSIQHHHWRYTRHFNTAAPALQTEDKIPVTVLSGFLGSGKTTLLNHALHNTSGLRIATIVNDMSEINIDSTMIEQGAFNRVDEELVQLTNGCICCTLRQDLIEEIGRLAALNKFDYILVESTGVSEPLPVAQTFITDDSLKQCAKLDTLVTTVDANNFLNFVNSHIDLQRLKMGATEDDRRPLSNLIVDQVEFANVILLNKCDLIDRERIDKIKQIVSMINPKAKVFETRFSEVDLQNVLKTNLYERDLNDFMTKPAWDEELNSIHVSELEQYGIHSFSFSNNARPFHPERLHQQLMTQQGSIFEGVLRAKGYFWIANDMDSRFDFNIAGPMFSIVVNTLWLEPAMRQLMDPAFVQQYLKENAESKEDVEAIKVRRRQILTDMSQRYDKLMSDGNERPFGDRRIEMVFIGESGKMQKELIQEQLQQCLLNDDELDKGPNYWNDCFQSTFNNVPRCIVI